MSVEIKAGADRSRRPPVVALMGGITLYLLLQILLLGVPAIGGSSEAREAQVVDVIFRDGTWVLPLRNGLIPSKPPLFHWIGALISEWMGGVSVFTVRLPSQLSAAFVLFLAGLVAFRFATATKSFESDDHPRRATFITACILSLTYGFYQLACQAMVDMTFTLCVWGAATSLVLCKPKLFREKGRVSESSRAMFWCCCSLGVIARGPLGLALPVWLAALAGLSTIGFRSTVREFARPSLGWLAFAIPALWYNSAYQIGGEAFLDRQIFFENVKRFSGGDFVNSEPWWFYLPSLLRTTFPWGVLVPVIFVFSLRERRGVSYVGRSLPHRWLPMLVLLGAVVVFSISSGKRHSYMLALYPLVAIQLGVELSTLFERATHATRIRLAQVANRLEFGFALLSIGALGALIACQESTVAAGLFPIPLERVLSVVIDRFGPIILVAAGVGLLGSSRSLKARCLSVWFVMLALQTVVVLTGSAIKAEGKGFDRMAQVWLSTTLNTDQLAVFKDTFDEYFDPMLFYVRRRVMLIPLEGISTECKSGTVYVAKRSWLDAHESLAAGMIVRVTTLREGFLAASDNTKRDIVVFRCHPTNSEGPFGGPLMHDAAWRGPSVDY